MMSGITEAALSLLPTSLMTVAASLSGPILRSCSSARDDWIAVMPLGLVRRERALRALGEREEEEEEEDGVAG